MHHTKTGWEGKAKPQRHSLTNRCLTCLVLTKKKTDREYKDRSPHTQYLRPKQIQITLPQIQEEGKRYECIFKKKTLVRIATVAICKIHVPEIDLTNSVAKTDQEESGDCPSNKQASSGD